MQPRMTSSARPRPTSRGSRCVPPPPGMIPTATSGWPKRALPSSGVAHVERHRALAAAAAADALDDGDGGLRQRPEAVPSVRGTGTARRAARCRRSAGPAISSTSACAMKNSGSAESTISTRTSSSPRPPASGGRSPAISGRSIRLIGGWSIVARQMPPSTATRSQLVVVVGHEQTLCDAPKMLTFPSDLVRAIPSVDEEVNEMSRVGLDSHRGVGGGRRADRRRGSVSSPQEICAAEGAFRSGVRPHGRRARRAARGGSRASAAREEAQEARHHRR